MTNLNNLKAAELKEMAKELKIKNWWTLKKADLITAINTVEEPEVEEPEIKLTPKKEEKEEKEEEVNPNDIITLKEIASELNIQGAKARRILRNSEIKRPYKRWEWHKTEHADIIQQVKDLLKK